MLFLPIFFERRKTNEKENLLNFIAFGGYIAIT